MGLTLQAKPCSAKLVTVIMDISVVKASFRVTVRKLMCFGITDYFQFGEIKPPLDNAMLVARCCYDVHYKQEPLQTMKAWVNSCRSFIVKAKWIGQYSLMSVL